jgi:AraC-like DNA-binding protein
MPHALPSASGFAAKCAIAALRRHNIPVQPLLRRAGLSEHDFGNSQHRVPAASQGNLLEYAAEAMQDTAFGLHLAEQVKPQEVGLLFYSACSARNLGEAVFLFARYFRIVNESVRFKLAPDPDGAVLEFAFVGVSPHRVKQNTEFWMAMIVKAAREVTGRRVHPVRVTCPHSRTEDLRRFARFFGCPVEFRAPSGQLRFSNEALALPLITHDTYLLETLKPFCEEAARARDTVAASFRASVERQVERLLPHGQADRETVARGLAVSVRTLTRRLAAEKTSFKEVVDQLRRSLALQYLHEPGFTLPQVGWLLGYEGATSFNHAFKRWNGCSPSAARDKTLDSARV